MIASTENRTLWDESGSRAARMQAEILQQVPDGPPGYRLRRIILTNFWLYDHQEFELPHGRLFLAGDNRSGKSTVLTAAITLALDGDYRPERIDTFGKREKRIDYYILGSLESQTPYTRDNRTSYVALEFEWCDPAHPPFTSELRMRWERGERESARFFTIGLAFHGNRNNATPITSLRFLITDGSRLEYDIPTVQGRGAARYACDLKTFKKTLADHGMICNTQAEYEQKVASYLFNFSNINDFRRLVRQLLYLRQPNISSVLSLEAVREFLDQSLPALPSELVQHAATTLEIMESLQEEIERRKDAYAAVERLHKAQQIVIMARARLSACEYIHVHLKADEIAAALQRIQRAITRAENDIRQLTTSIEKLQEEQFQIEGQLSALKDSEGLQAVQKIAALQGEVADLEQDLQAQQATLDDCIRHREQRTEQIEKAGKVFDQARQNSEQLLGTLHTLATEQALWQLAADQLAELLKQVRGLFSDAASFDVTAQVSTLQEVPVQERLRWLRSLKQLHQELADTTTRLQIIQQQEIAAFEALDEATRAFGQAREQVCLAQQNLADRIDTLLDQSDLQTCFITLGEQAALAWDEGGTPQEIVGRLGALQQEYTAAVAETLDALGAALGRLQERIAEMKGEQAVKAEALSQARATYEQKRQEPEYIPHRSEHRWRARKRLEASGIPALPLYMLIDFVPEIDSQSAAAGGIEDLLEDAGLLDALVVSPTHSAAADGILRDEGLSDCRIDSEQLDRFSTQKRTQQPAGISSNGLPDGQGTLLRIDPALRDTFGEESASWEEAARPIVQVLEQFVYPDLAQGKTWVHGLLRGIAGDGAARCIGKATRVREQQRELERLHQCCMQLESELEAIERKLTDIAQERDQQEALRSQLGFVLQESGVEEQLAALKSSLSLLTQAQSRYQREHEKVQALRQQISTLKVRLQKEAGDVPVFSSTSESVERAYDSTNRLESEYKSLLSYLDNLRTSWLTRRSAQMQLDQDKAAEWRAEQARLKVERELTEARTHLRTLERLVDEKEHTNIAELLASQQQLQARQKSLPEELRKAQEQRAKSQGIIESKREEHTNALLEDEQARKLCDSAYQYLLVQLDTYPTEMLIAIKQQLNIKPRLAIAQDVLGEPLAPEEDAYQAMKSRLERHAAEEQNTLFKTASEVNNLLHEYGPQFDELGIIRFLNADRINALELLTRLNEELRHHEQLLEARERELFQNFLLEEMADTVGKHITEAEQWVERMNTLLGQTAFVGEYYRLRWVPRKSDQERGQEIPRLAQYHELLRRQVQTFKQEEIEALVHAFRQEINTLRTQATGAATFTEALAHVLDYRTWFQFELYITRKNSSPQHLTNRFFKKGSGAEQFVMLYIPFFAALSALYESAWAGAPRLIALDEAFEKVSQENTRNLLGFLASQQFQWIMSGPRATGEGAAIPACVKYTMFCQKEKELAVGFPSFWSAALPAGSSI
ncbi:MAG TPA: SbcC/MukB-like Walker B domain-containing protein [Ktedonobacteraceae bacterium]|nr:SbcC/MukB-like Walker B domain-containing protein [Ktedonobacteraceae bacterium]